jgi:NAD(P)-dependent dehydrogenase (short-subunit alcohol dehydrogenase family)
VLITGGGRGIGAATALLAADHGYAVCVNYRTNAAAADSVVQEIIAKGGTAIAIQADVGLEPDVVKLFVQVDQTFGSLAAVVNNAGVVEQQAQLDAMDSARLRRDYLVIGIFH